MCGIAGIWYSSTRPEELLRNNATIMTNTIKKRGPDDEGVWIDDHKSLVFAHTRLSIVDLSFAGHQPMISLSKRYVLTFNGEIYNHIEIRQMIKQDSRWNKKWRGNCDTETFLEAIELFGLKNTLNKCRGMFAFGLWDNKKKELILGRDRFGEKPLYWGSIHLKGENIESIIFSSDLSTFKCLKGFTSLINHSSLRNLINFGAVSSPSSIYKDITQVPPGHIIKFSKRNGSQINNWNINSEIWWNTLKISENNAKLRSEVNNSFEEIDYINQLEEELIKVLNLQSNADVPLCTFLSGGLDSSLITTLLQKESSKPINTFTISFPDQNYYKGFDEGPKAREISSFLKTNHTNVPITNSEAQNIIPSLSNFYSEPFADSSQIPTSIICREASERNLKVALSGDGGDELFGGYNRHRIGPEIYSLFSKYPIQIKKYIALLVNSIPFSNQNLIKNKLQKFAAGIENSETFESLYLALQSPFYRQNNKLFLNKVNHDLEMQKIIFSGSTFLSNHEKFMLQDIISYLPSDILVKVDRASMAFGLETRAPFLDYKIANLAWMMPSNIKIKRYKGNLKGKWILRQILNKYIPKRIINGPKKGFAAPIGPWLRGPLKEWATDLLSSSTLKAQGYFNEKYIEKLWTDHLDGSKDNSNLLWSILMWQSWLMKWE